LTTDFLITLRLSNEIKYLARSIKSSTELHDKRTLEKLEIEREYWTRQNVNWALVTEKELDEKFCRNMAVFHSAFFPKKSEIISYKQELIDFLRNANGPLSKDLLVFDGENNLEEGTSLALFKHLVAKKEIRFDIGSMLFHSRIYSKRFEYSNPNLAEHFLVGREAN